MTRAAFGGRFAVCHPCQCVFFGLFINPFLFVAPFMWPPVGVVFKRVLIGIQPVLHCVTVLCLALYSLEKLHQIVHGVCGLHCLHWVLHWVCRLVTHKTQDTSPVLPVARAYGKVMCKSPFYFLPLFRQSNQRNYVTVYYHILLAFPFA